MEIIIRKLVYVVILFLLIEGIFVQKANAASLISVSDTISTSRPSAAAPLYSTNGIAANSNQASIFDNGSFFLASDSAVILKDAANETSDVSLKVASMSATGLPVDGNPKFGGAVNVSTGNAYSAVDGADFKPAGNFSITAWFRTTTTGVNQYIFTSYSQNPNSAGILLAVNTGNSIVFRSGKNTGTTSGVDYLSDYLTTPIVTDGNWHFVVATWDGTKLHVYIDGSEIGTGVSWSYAPVFAATNYVRVGCYSGNGTNSNFFQGSLDDVSFWNGRALSSSDVTTLYNNELYTQSGLLSDSNLKAYYRFEENALTTDTTANAHTLTVIGSPLGITTKFGRFVYFTNTTSYTHHEGVALITSVTATHQIKFTTVSTIPNGGTIVLSFPGSGNNTASPSANGFSFNGMTTSNPSNVKCYPTTACNNGNSITITGSNTITLTTSASIAGGTTIYADIGCTTAASGPCTVFMPQLINPVKTAAAGTADAWKITIQTTDTPANGSVILDSAIVKAATIESVQVQGTVEPTITFTIAGVPNGGATNFNALGATGCGSEFANTGIDSTATNINLGLLNSGVLNKVAQTLTVTTNGYSGYAITATASGHLINPATGAYFSDANGPSGSNPLTANDTPGPQPIASGSSDFGISPCGARVPTLIWGFSGTIVSNSNFSNPWNTGSNGYAATIASYTGGPVSNDVTVVRYAVGVSVTQPAGIYFNVISYVATASF